MAEGPDYVPFECAPGLRLRAHERVSQIHHDNISRRLDRIELLMTEARFDYLQERGEKDQGEEKQGEAKSDLVHLKGDEDFLELDFCLEEQKDKAWKSKPRIGNGDELKRAYIKWLKKNKPGKLECKVEKLLEQRGELCDGGIAEVEEYTRYAGAEGHDKPVEERPPYLMLHKCSSLATHHESDAWLGLRRRARGSRSAKPRVRW